MRNIAFVRYRLRGAAEFAKVAMADQPLDGDEKLNVRWAYDDPNPIAKAVEEQTVAAQFIALVKEKIAEKREYDTNITLPPEKRQMVTYAPNVAFKYSVRPLEQQKAEGTQEDDIRSVAQVKQVTEETRQKYAPNRFTGYFHPYTYGLFYPKQAEEARKNETQESSEDSDLEDVAAPEGIH